MNILVLMLSAIVLLTGAGPSDGQSAYWIIFSSDRDTQGQTGGRRLPGQSSGPEIPVYELFALSPVGTELFKLTDSQRRDQLPFFPGYQVSPDGGKILSNTWRNNGSADDIALVNPDGTVQVKLTDTGAVDASPVWSPDGTKIAFNSDRGGGRSDVFVMDADGANQINLTNDTDAIDSGPQWSPDGSMIVYASDRRGTFNIHIMSADGSGQINLTAGPGSNQDPKWSPDGSKISFERSIEVNSSDIFVMDPDGSNVINLTNHPASDIRVAWSLDGTQIFFDSDRGGNRDIYSVNVDGTGLVKLTDHPADDLSPFLVPFEIISPTNIETISWGYIKRMH